MSRARTRRLARGLIFASLATTAAPLVVALAASTAHARPGAGNTYRAPSTPSRSSGTSSSSSSKSSSSSSSSSSGSSSSSSSSRSSDSSTGDDSPLSILFALACVVLFVPAVLIYLLLKAVALAVQRGLAFVRGLFGKTEGAGAEDWSTDTSAFAPATATVAVSKPASVAPPAPMVPEIVVPPPSVPAAIASLGGADPAFSDDELRAFVGALFAAVHRRRGEGRLDALAPYLVGPVRGFFDAYGATTAVTGARLTDFVIEKVVTKPTPTPRVQVVVKVVGQYVERKPNGGAEKVGAVERWTLSRSPTAVTKPRAETLALGCPRCAAPIEADGNLPRAGLCPACDQRVDDGTHAWLVTAAQSVSLAGPFEVLPDEPSAIGAESVRALRPLEVLRPEPAAIGGDAPSEVLRDVPAAIAALGGKDEDFSWIVFEDFVASLYVSAHSLRGEGRIEDLAAYLSSEARTAFGRDATNTVSLPVLGAMRLQLVEALTEPTRLVRVVLELEGNYTETPKDPADGPARIYIAVERWSFVRSPDAISRKPEDARLLGCPSCGAAVGAKGPSERGVRCAYCKELVDTGAFDWLVESIVRVSREERDDQLTGDVEEVGTDLRSVVAKDAEAAYAALLVRDPTQEWAAVAARVTLVFDTFQKAWSALDLAAMRPLLSDNLFEIQPRFVASYRARGLRNVTTGSRLSRLEAVRLLHDRHYDALTVRLHASGPDYTVDANDRVVAGSKTKPRSYTEYWTFIRAAGRLGAPRLDLACPACGAPNDLEMAGNCNVCKAKITNGAFDWVLTRIEQDESYVG